MKAKPVKVWALRGKDGSYYTNSQTKEETKREMCREDILVRIEIREIKRKKKK